MLISGTTELASVQLVLKLMHGGPVGED